MGLPTLFLIAVGLSADAFAVSVSNGMCYRNFNRLCVCISAFTFGLFQMLMPLAGYYMGRTFSEAIVSVDHWIALFLLGSIGGKMALDGFYDLRNPQGCRLDRSYNTRVMLVQAVATSIDALAVGIGFAVLQVNIVVAASVIGIITFACCLFGCCLGRRFGMLLGKRTEIIGGIILCSIGVKVFIEHVFF